MSSTHRTAIQPPDIAEQCISVAMNFLLLVVFVVVGTTCHGFVLPTKLRGEIISFDRARNSLTCSTRLACVPSGRGGLCMYDEVGPQAAHKLTTKEGYSYIDVRTDDEFKNGRPAGSINITAFIPGGQGMLVNVDFVDQVAEKFPDKSSKLVLGCQMGSRSAKASELLEEAGYEAIVNMGGGFSAWARDESLPIEI